MPVRNSAVNPRKVPRSRPARRPRVALLGPSVTPPRGVAVPVFAFMVYLVPEPEAGGFSALTADLLAYLGSRR